MRIVHNGRLEPTKPLTIVAHLRKFSAREAKRCPPAEPASEGHPSVHYPGHLLHHCDARRVCCFFPLDSDARGVTNVSWLTCRPLGALRRMNDHSVRRWAHHEQNGKRGWVRENWERQCALNLRGRIHSRRRCISEVE